MSTPAGDDLVGDATIRVDGNTDPAMRALQQFSRDTQGRLRDLRGRFASESQAINRQLANNPPTLDVDTGPATDAIEEFTRDAQGRLRDLRGRFISESRAINRHLENNPPTLTPNVDTEPALQQIDEFTRDAQGRLRDASGRFVRTGDDISRSLTTAAANGDRFGNTLRSITRIAGRAAGAIGTFTGAVGALGAAAGPAVSLLAGIVTTLQQIAPASTVAVSGMLAMQQASAAVRLGMVGVEEAVTAALDPSKAEEFNEALEKLAPNARAFAVQLREMAPAFQRFQQGVQNRLFAGFADELDRLSSSVLPVVRQNLNATATTLNQMALGAAGAARELATDGTLGKAMAGANEGLSNLRMIPGQVVTALGQLAVAGAPAFDRLTQAASDKAIEISDRLSAAFDSGALQQAVDTAIDVLRDLGDVARNVFAIIGNVAAPFQAAGGGLVNTLSEITGALREATATKGFQDAMSALAQVMSTLARTVGPLLRQALAAVGPVFTTLGPPVERLIQDLGEGLSPIIEALGPVLTAASIAVGALVRAVSPLLPVVGELVASLLPAVTPLFDALTTVFVGLQPVISGIATVLQQALAPILAQLPALVQPFADLISTLARSLFPVLAQVVAALAPSLAQIGASFGELLASVAPLLAVLGQLIGELLVAMVPVLQPIIMMVGQLASVLADQFASVVTNVLVPALQLVTNLLRGDFSAAWESLKALFTGVLRHLANTSRDILNAVKAIVTGVIDFFVELFNTLIGNSIVPDLVNGIVRLFASLPGRALSAISSLAGSLARLIRDAGSRMLSALRTGIGNLLSLLRSLPGRARSALGNLGSLLYNSGRALIQGFINGIRSLAGSVKDAASGVLSGARNLFPFSPAKEGPFSGQGWTLFSGRAISEALAEGIAQREQLVRRAAAMVASTAQTAVSTPVVDATPSLAAARVGALPVARPAGSTVINVHLNFTNDGVIGSRIELENWLARTLDQIARTGRIPATLRTA